MRVGMQQTRRRAWRLRVSVSAARSSLLRQGGNIVFHPHSFGIGDHVKINRELSNKEGTFDAGHEFEIIEMYARNGMDLYDLRDSDLNLLGEVPFEDISWA